MRAVRTMLTVAGAGTLSLLLVACGSGGPQVGSIAAEDNPPAEAGPTAASSRRDIERERAQDRENDPRTEEEERRADAREAADKVREIAGDIKNGVTEARFTMPRLKGRTLQDAQDLLQSRGSYLLDQVDATDQERFQLLDANWKVCSQSPAAGTRPLKTKLVRLEAVQLDERCP